MATYWDYNSAKIIDNTIFIFDRGYPLWYVYIFRLKFLFFLMRVSSAFKLSNSTSINDSSITHKANGISKNLRIIKIELPDGSIVTLVTNIFNNPITPLLFKELYFYVGKFKYIIEIEAFLENKPVTIQKYFYQLLHLLYRKNSTYL